VSRYDEAVLAWAAHLRSGGTTPWTEFWPSAPAGAQGEPPGAVQLELVRRLAAAWEGPGFERLADRVLHRDAPGRGMATLPLVHPAAPGGVGAPPLDPIDVPVQELLRLGTGVLADLALAAPAATSNRGRRRRRTAVVLGAPITRHGFAERTPRAGGVFILAPSMDQLLTEVWSTRAQLGAGVRWRRFVQTWAGRDLLPLSADAARLAARVARRVGADRVHVMVGSAGVSPGAERPRPGDPVPLAPESVDLLRRLNPVLGVHVREEGRDAVRANAVRLLAGGPARPLPIPARHRPWAQGCARRIADQLVTGGYAVHGDLDEFVEGIRTPPLTMPDVLDRLVDVVVRAVREEQR